MTAPSSERSPWPFRPHHLMCWQTYRGNGYSAAFVTNFDALKATVATRPDQPIRLAVAADPICAPCPQRRDESCLWAESVNRRDQALLDQTGFAAGQVMALDDALAFVEPRFLDLQQHVCVACEWQGLCASIYRQDHP